MRFALAALLALIPLCASAEKIPANGTYASRLGNFQCQGYPLGADVIEALGPHGGTIRISDVAREIRFDVEEFEPALDQGTLEANRAALYEGYLAQNIVPLLRSVSPAMQLLETKAITLATPRSLAGLPVHKSAILMPERNLLRGQLQYSDGRFMYTMSSLTTVKPNSTAEKYLDVAYEQLLIGLSWCQFPQAKGGKPNA
jgi:hypothetical protein